LIVQQQLAENERTTYKAHGNPAVDAEDNSVDTDAVATLTFTANLDFSAEERASYTATIDGRR